MGEVTSAPLSPLEMMLGRFQVLLNSLRVDNPSLTVPKPTTVQKYPKPAAFYLLSCDICGFFKKPCLGGGFALSAV